MALSRGAIYFNPSSGEGLEDEVRRLRERVAEEKLDFVEIDDQLDLRTDIVERLRRGQRTFVAAGGDGTLHWVAQPLVNTDAVLGVLPIGTFNHFARDIDMPEDWQQALDVIFGPHDRQVDVGAVGSRYFMNNISLGIYPSIVKKREDLRKKHGKYMAYFLAVQAAIRRMPHLTLNLEAGDHLEIVSTHLFFVSVNPYDLGEWGVIAPRESLEGGKLAIYWIPHKGTWAFIRDMARYLRGRVGLIEGLRAINSRTLRVDAAKKDLRVGVDGELWRTQLPMKIRIVPGGLNVKVPEAALNER